MGCEKSMKLHQKRKKVRNIGESVKLCFLTFNRKLKSENAWDHHSILIWKNLMKDIKKRLNAKLERHLARPYSLLYEIFAYIYIYIYIDK